MLVGAGTGIAPLRGMIRERQVGEETSSNILVFGCRKRNDDYLYGPEWESAKGGDFRMINAFSQESAAKMYVQRALREADEGQGALIVEHLLVNRGAMYIAGGAKMAQSVKEEVVEAIANVVEGGKKDAEKILAKLKRSGDFAVEAWS